jgi:diguanylate cyclase (GGDEF)-like protein
MAAAAISGDPVRASAERPQRVLVVLIPLGLVAVAVLFAALAEFAAVLREGHGTVLVTLVVAAVAARAISVELIGVTGTMSFEFVVVVSAAILYGTAVAVIVAAVAELLVQLVYRPRLAIVGAYNGVSAILQAGAAGAVASLSRGSGHPAEVIVATGAASVAWIAVNLTLAWTAVVRSTTVPKLPVFKQAAREVTPPFLFMTSLVALIVVAWRESPILALAAVGPIAAIPMYQSRRLQAATANTMALTDPLTGIGNRRHFDDRLARELERATRLRIPFSVCLLDIDDFKAINDTYGHAAGDEVLAATASCLRRDGEAFRCGGDEFALLLPGFPEAEAAEAAAAVCGRIGELTDPGGRPLVVSAGTATLSPTSSDPADLLRAADLALYAQKSERHHQSRLPTRLT